MCYAWSKGYRRRLNARAVCSSGQPMLQTSEGGLGRSSDLQDLHANERPTDASEMAKRWFKSQIFPRCFRRLLGRSRKAKDAKLPGAGIIPKLCSVENAKTERMYEMRHREWGTEPEGEGQCPSGCSRQYQSVGRRAAWQAASFVAERPA